MLLTNKAFKYIIKNIKGEYMSYQSSTNPSIDNYHVPLNTNSSAVSWSAIFAGAAAAAALSFILVVLGAGLGFSSVSPWANTGISAKTLGLSTIIWLTVTQIFACGVGGYLAGRLRTKWHSVHNDEVYFRDTAHGMLVWAISCLGLAICLGSTISNIVSGGASMGGKIVSGIGETAKDTVLAASHSDITGYSISSLFRSPQTEKNDEAMQAESVKIFVHDLKDGKLSQENKTYIAQMIAAKTKISQSDAEKRVEEAFNKTHQTIEETKVKAKEGADKARKTAAAAAVWMFVALLCGALAASFLATFGGKQRDEIKVS